MGASQSTPPPLVQVSAPRGKVLVPPGTAFTVHPPPPYSCSRSDSYTRGGGGGPVFVPTPYGPFPRGHRGGRHVPRYGGGTDIEIAEGSEDSESMVGDVAEAMGPCGGMRGRDPKGYAGDTPMMGGRRGSGYGRFDAFGSRPRSAPEVMPMGGYPPNMLWSMPMGGVGGAGGAGGGAVPGDPRMGGAGMVGGPLPPFGIPPPEYTSNPNLARFSGDGTVPAAGVHPCANYAGPSPPSPPSSSSTPPQQPTPRTAASGRPHHDYDRVPMGAFADMAKKPPRTSRACTDPQTSARLNRGQTSHKVGPSGKEWLEGDAFLDACICTTNCSCRKGQRVLYRARADGHKASDSDGEEYEYRSGEIRYVLKDDLGRDCGDHSGCRKGGEIPDSDEDSKRSKRKVKKEGKQLKEQFQGFKDDLLEALDERLQDMRKESRHKSEAPDPARPSLGAPAFGQSSFMMNGPQLDPRLARQMPMVNCNPYGMPPSGIGQMPHGISGLAAAAGKAGFGDDASEWHDMGHADMETTPYMQPGWMVSRSKRNNKGMPRPNVMPHHGAKARGRVAGEDMGMDSSNGNRAMARYSQGMEGRGATMIGRHGNNSNSRGKREGRGKGGGRLLDSESDDDHDDDDFASSIRSGKQRQRQQQQRARLDRTGRGGGRLGSQDQDMPNRLDFGASPIAKSSTSTGTTSSRDRARQARADTDDDAY